MEDSKLSVVAPISTEPSDADIEERVKKIIRWTGFICQDMENDHIVQSLARESLNMLVGPSALHNNSKFKTDASYRWAMDLLDMAII